MRKTLWEDVVRKTFLGGRCEKDVVTCDKYVFKKVVVRKIFLLTFFSLLTNIRDKECFA